MKQLKKQWNKVTALLLTIGMVFGLFAAVPVQAEDGNASGSTIFDVKIVHTNDIHARVEEDDYNQVDRNGPAERNCTGIYGRSRRFADVGFRRYFSWTIDCDTGKGRISGKTDESLWI